MRSNIANVDACASILFDEKTGIFQDDCLQQDRDRQNQESSAYRVRPLRSQTCEETTQSLATCHPNLHIKSGYGVLGACTVDTDNQIGDGSSTHRSELDAEGFTCARKGEMSNTRVANDRHPTVISARTDDVRPYSDLANFRDITCKTETMRDPSRAMIACAVTLVLLMFGDITPLLVSVAALVSIMVLRKPSSASASAVVEGMENEDQSRVRDLQDISSNLVFVLEQDPNNSDKFDQVYSKSTATKDAFAVSTPALVNAPKWTGPSSETMLSKDSISVFITTTPPTHAELDSESQELFLATGNALSEASDKLEVKLFVQDRELHAVYAHDRVSVAYPTQTATRTHYMTRSSKGIRVGFFEPFSSVSGESKGATDARSVIVNTNSASCVINRTQAAIGRIRSAIAFHEDIHESDESASIDKCKTVISERILRSCPAFKTIEDKLRTCSASSSTPAVTSPAITAQCEPGWTHENAAKMSDACKAAIHATCTQNPKQEGCECWDESNDEYKTARCVTIRSLYKGREDEPKTTTTATGATTGTCGVEPATKTTGQAVVGTTAGAVDKTTVDGQAIQEIRYMKPPTMFEYMTPI